MVRLNVTESATHDRDPKDVREQTKPLRCLGKEHARQKEGHMSISQRPAL